MKKQKEASFGVMLIVLFVTFYIFSSYFLIHLLTDKFSIPWFDEILFLILLTITCGLVVYGYWNPDFLFKKRADKKRVLLIKRIWSATRNFSEESIDDIEKRINDIFYSL